MIFIVTGQRKGPGFHQILGRFNSEYFYPLIFNDPDTLLEIEYVFKFLIKCYTDYQRKFGCWTELPCLD